MAAFHQQDEPFLIFGKHPDRHVAHLSQCGLLSIGSRQATVICHMVCIEKAKQMLNFVWIDAVQLVDRLHVLVLALGEVLGLLFLPFLDQIHLVRSVASQRLRQKVRSSCESNDWFISETPLQTLDAAELNKLNYLRPGSH